MPTRQTVTSRIYTRLRASREQDGAAIVESKVVAKLIRARLRDRFPSTTFSVRSDHNSVDIHWEDGPCDKTVDAVVGCYSFGGFDGMIDMAYDSQNWLLPDGTMEAASCRGTEGSMGTVPAYATDCPQPGAILVKFGPRYIFTHRTVSEALMADLVRTASLHYGFEYDPAKPLHGQRDGRGGEWITTLAYRLERESLESATA